MPEGWSGYCWKDCAREIRWQGWMPALIFWCSQAPLKKMHGWSWSELTAPSIKLIRTPGRASPSGCPRWNRLRYRCRNRWPYAPFYDAFWGRTYMVRTEGARTASSFCLSEAMDTTNCRRLPVWSGMKTFIVAEGQRNSTHPVSGS